MKFWRSTVSSQWNELFALENFFFLEKNWTFIKFPKVKVYYFKNRKNHYKDSSWETYNILYMKYDMYKWTTLILTHFIV